MKRLIEIPDLWLEQDPSAVMHIEKWLEDNAPCGICHGLGGCLTGDQYHMGPENDVLPCPTCGYETWVNPCVG